MKKIITMLFLSLLVSSVFAFDWVKVVTAENEEMETYNLYLDLDAREPFYIKTESIEYFLLLQDLYEEVEVLFVKKEEMEEDEGFQYMLDFAFENDCYAMRMEYEDYCSDIHINIDGSVTMYTYGGLKNLTEE